MTKNKNIGYLETENEFVNSVYYFGQKWMWENFVSKKSPRFGRHFSYGKYQIILFLCLLGCRRRKFWAFQTPYYVFPLFSVKLLLQNDCGKIRRCGNFPHSQISMWEKRNFPTLNVKKKHCSGGCFFLTRSLKTVGHSG